MGANLFYQQRSSNYYDNLKVDVKELYARYPIEKVNAARKDKKTLLSRIYYNSFIPIKLRNYVWYFFHRGHFDFAWLDQFRKYWSTVLGGRPLWDEHDFYFLRNIYRLKFQENQVPDSADAGIHLDSWQRPELMYQLFHQVFKESLTNQLGLWRHVKRSLNRPLQSFLEFGCATAPVTATFFEFYKNIRNVQVYISDIQTLAFHYASYRFNMKNVTPLLLTPENEFSLPDDIKVEVVFCITVFEHLNSPLAIIKKFHSILKRGGLLFFDYIKSDGEGLDTIQGVKERNAVLYYVDSNFNVVFGKISYDENMGLTIVRKK